MARTTQPGEQARKLRKEQTSAEQVPWELLRNRQLLHLKFRRQYPINRYIADFCCTDLRLVIEVDGEVHSAEAQIAHDENRDCYLRSLGYAVLRFSNERVLGDSATVLDEIAHLAVRLRPSLIHLASRVPPPLPGSGGGGAGEGAGG